MSKCCILCVIVWKEKNKTIPTNVLVLHLKTQEWNGLQENITYFSAYFYGFSLDLALPLPELRKVAETCQNN